MVLTRRLCQDAIRHGRAFARDDRSILGAAGLKSCHIGSNDERGQCVRHRMPIANFKLDQSFLRMARLRP